MINNELLNLLDAQIDKLTRVRTILLDEPRPARQPTINLQASEAPIRRTRTMSAEGRKRISDAAKARWAAKKAGKPAKK